MTHPSNLKMHFTPFANYFSRAGGAKYSRSSLNDESLARDVARNEYLMNAQDRLRGRLPWHFQTDRHHNKGQLDQGAQGHCALQMNSQVSSASNSSMGNIQLCTTTEHPEV